MAHAQSVQAVRLEVEPGLTDEQSLRAALRELLARIGVTLLEPEAEQDTAGAVLADVVVSKAPQGAKVRVYALRRADASSVHHVAEAESDALLRETIAHVVLGAVEALRREEESPRGEAPAPPSPHSPARGALFDRITLGVLLGPQRMGPERGAALLAAHGDLQLRTHLPMIVGIELGAALSPRHERLSVDSKVAMGLLRVRAGLVAVRRARWQLAVLGSAGADVLAVRAQARALARVRSPVRRLDPVLGLLVELDLTLWRGLALRMRAACDLDLLPRELVALTAEGESTLFALGRVRPHAALGLRWSTR